MKASGSWGRAREFFGFAVLGLFVQREMRKTFLVPSLREEQRLQQSCRICRSLKVFGVELTIKSPFAGHKLIAQSVAI